MNAEMSGGSEAARKEKSLVYSLRDGMAWSVMVGFGEQYVGAYALFLAATTMQMGILAALPPFLGAISQVFAASLTDRVQKRRRIIVTSAGLQGLVWLLILSVPVLAPSPAAVPLLIGCLCLLAIGGQFTVPAWSSLMRDLVPPETLGDYFGRRNRICHFFTIAAVGAAGLVLHLFKSAGASKHLYGFVVIFFVACLARLVSTMYLSMQYEPPYQAPAKEDRFGFFEFLTSMSRNNFGRYCLFISLMTFAVNLSAPFFVVYILRELNFSYLQFTLLNCTVVLSQILTLVFWGRAADRFGNKWVMMVSGSMICLTPLLLCVSSNFYYILAFQFFAASVGGGFTLAAANYVFDAVSPRKHARCVAYFHVTNAIGVLLGGMAGGWLAGHVSAAWSLGPIHIDLPSALLTVFIISGILRILIMFAFRSAFQEIRPVEPSPCAKTLFQMMFQAR